MRLLAQRVLQSGRKTASDCCNGHSGGPKGPDPEEEWRKSRFDGAGMVATGSGTASQAGTHAGMSQGWNVIKPEWTRSKRLAREFLQSTSTPMKHATRFKNRSLTIAKGTMIDCALKTRIVSTVPGMTACVVSRNIYSDDGKVVLIERGSELTGNISRASNKDRARLFVLWNRIKTPNGVIVTLDSPGTDPLGGSGIPGYVDSHWWTRFGNAILMTMIQDWLCIVGATVSEKGFKQFLGDLPEHKQWITGHGNGNIEKTASIFRRRSM